MASAGKPADAVQLARAFHDAGVPPSVLNLVFGTPSDISEYLIPQPSVRLVTFTGSIPVGKRLAAMAGQHMKPAIMELGGHAPVIVCEDVDPLASAATSVMGKSRNAGQVCVSPTRFFVHQEIYGAFADAFAEKARAIKVGDGLDPANQMGPLANHRRIETMETLVADAKQKGARVLAGGSRIGNRGYYYPLTVLADLPDDARAMREPFGPLASINGRVPRGGDRANAILGSRPLLYGRRATPTRLAKGVGSATCRSITSSPRSPDSVRRRQGQVQARGGTEGLQCYGGEERLASDDVANSAPAIRSAARLLALEISG